MAYSMKMALLGTVILVFIHLNQLVYGEPQVPCFFIFGDSLSDPGNNNFLVTSAKANCLPYGIDFPYGPTGRFCNGKTTMDIITEHLGFGSFIPPYNNPLAEDIMRGINYASASAGILEETGQLFGQRFSMDAQLTNHQQIISRIKFMIGDDTNQYLNKCLYSVWMGNNDLGTYYLQSFSQKYTDLECCHLYDLGAKKIVIMGLWPGGCTPAGLNISGRCKGGEDPFSKSFNAALKDVVAQLNKKLNHANFTYINTYNIFLDNYNDFKVKDVGCCDVRECHSVKPPCLNRDDYVFFDYVHTTEFMNQFIGKRAYSAEKPTDASPFDIKHLVQM